MLERFEKDHRYLAELADRIEACLDNAGPVVAMRLGQLRCALAHEAVRHTIVEDRLIYCALDKADPQWMARHRESFPCLRTNPFLQQLQQHIQDWDCHSVQDDRPRHAATIRELLQLMRTRMALEEQFLYPRFRALPVPRGCASRRAPSADSGMRRTSPGSELPPA